LIFNASHLWNEDSKKFVFEGTLSQVPKIPLRPLLPAGRSGDSGACEKHEQDEAGAVIIRCNMVVPPKIKVRMEHAIIEG
jgi:hypothetical protein